MSGDLGPRVAISAAQKFLHLHPDVELILVGDQSQLARWPIKSSQISIVHAADVVAMSDEPLTALRHKKDSSMWLALDQLRAERADACVSAGNTGALLAMAKYQIKTLDGVERPAICKSMPVAKGQTFLLDLGANIEVGADILQGFALMGSALARASGCAKPRVALLNIGTESHKGTEVLQQAQTLLQNDARLNYVGFIEADSIFSGKVDVIVCDGFHGNIALKSSEGAARFIAQQISAEFRQHISSRFMAFLAWPMLKRLRTQLNPARYNGASLLGLKKIVIKSHGGANESAFVQALAVAREQVIQQVPLKIAQQFSQF